MKQIEFEFLPSQPRELPVPLEESTQEELVELMATAIWEVHRQTVEGRDDGSSAAEQDHAGAS
jgi:hypothetical protein